MDLGDYTLGSTCLRKAELYYIVNTMIMECCFEANAACHDGYDPKDPLPGAKWYYANEENAEDFLRKLDEVELAIADDRRPVPEWGTDDVVWSNVTKSRYKAAHDDAAHRARVAGEVTPTTDHEPLGERRGELRVRRQWGGRGRGRRTGRRRGRRGCPQTWPQKAPRD